jgi:hypothetical protein
VLQSKQESTEGAQSARGQTAVLQSKQESTEGGQSAPVVSQTASADYLQPRLVILLARRLQVIFSVDCDTVSGFAAWEG